MNKQLLLIDVPPDKVLAGTGALRTWYGNCLQEIVCNAMGWEPGKINGAKRICPDAFLPDKTPAEIKSVSLSPSMNGQSIIYEWRMRKEIEHCPDMLYAFIGHIPPPGDPAPRTLADLLDKIERSELYLAMVPSLIVHAEAKQSPLRKLKVKHDNPRNGWAREGYREGYRELNVSRWFAGRKISSCADAFVFGRQFNISIIKTR